MEYSEFIGPAILALFIQYALIYFAIYMATSSTRNYQKIQTNLLVKMARKAGVAEEDIKSCYDIK